MSIHNLRKALGLLIVDIVIIIGIFVLQFRTDSSIIEKLGNLQITLEKTDAATSEASDELALNNKFRLSYNGLNIFCDDQNPIKVEGSTTNKTLELISYQKTSDLSYQLVFSQNVKLRIFLSSLDTDASFNIYAELPPKVSTIYVPYSYSYNLKIKKEEGNHIIFEEKKNSWELQGLSFNNGYIAISQTSNQISYASYTDTKQFSFDSITELAIASQTTYDENIAAIKSNLITAFTTNTAESNISEQTVVSYIAAMGEKGNYIKAIDSISQSFKHSTDRTYLSAPYLNNLQDMNEKLEEFIWTNEALISASAQNGSLNILGIRNLAAFLCIHSKSSEVLTILNNVKNINTETCTLSQAIGILQLYLGLVDLNPTYADALLPVLEPCVDRIATMCSLNGTILTISENDTFVSVVQAVEIGVTLLRYGTLTKNTVIQKAGYAIVNSYISESSSFDLRTLSNLYPIIAYNNWYYPHFKKIKIDATDTMWAWTCARNIKVNTSGEEMSFVIDFPEGQTHYLIVKGVPKFHTIYIYNMAFRTDPRFETYNSSGYVYKRESKTLLLKSRHKSRVEEIRIEFGDKALDEAPPIPKTSTITEIEKSVQPETAANLLPGSSENSAAITE